MRRFLNTVNLHEIKKFNDFDWWDVKGNCKHLHLMNIVRMEYLQYCIKEYYGENRPCNVLDVGCGGGIACESMHRLGHKVTGIDANKKNIEVASQHSKFKIDYRNDSVENLNEKFDVVVSFEVLEHVDNQESFLKKCASLTNGLLIISTINRNFTSFLAAICIAENVLGMLPRGTHDHEKFVTVEESKKWMQEGGLSCIEPKGMIFNPLKNRWHLSNFTCVNYMLAGLK